MNDNTKIELAREIMNAMIGTACRNGYNKDDKIIKTLLKEEKQMNSFNFDVIDRIIKVYGPMVKEGKV